MRARYYSSDLMRFINQDIITGDISNSGSLNRYAYVNGNPVTMIDPFGLEAEKKSASKNVDIWDLCCDFIDNFFNAERMRRMSISARNQANFLYAISELSGKAQQGAEGFTVAATVSAIGISVDSLGLLATPTGGALYLGEEATVWVFPAAGEAVTLGLGVVKHITKAASLKLYIDSFHYAAKADEKETNSTSQMIGENGTRTTSTSTWKNGKVERIDVENPNPGVRPGQIHYHDAYNNKYYYDIEERVFYNQKSGEVAPKTVNELLKDKDFLRGIRKGLKMLGE